MKRLLFSAALVAAVGFGTYGLEVGAAFGQANEDNVASAQSKYPLAAKAGEDSHAMTRRPPGAVNQGPFDMTNGNIGHAWDAPPGSKIWNPVKIKMLQGGKVDRWHAIHRQPIRRSIAPWPMPATTSSGPRCSTSRGTWKSVAEHVGGLPLRQGGAGRAHCQYR